MTAGAAAESRITGVLDGCQWVVAVAGAGKEQGSWGINSRNSNSEPGQRAGTHERGSGRRLRSLTWGQGDRLRGRTVNPMPVLVEKVQLIRLTGTEKGLCRRMQGTPRAEIPSRAASNLCGQLVTGM
ncbi:hypothetical protein GCM10009731_53740 [Streptomyces globosus]